MNYAIRISQCSVRVIILLFLTFVTMLQAKAAETNYGVAVLNEKNELVFSYAPDSRISSIENLAKIDSRIHVWRAKTTKKNGSTYFYFDDLRPWKDYAGQIERVVFNNDFSATLWGQLSYWFADMTSLTEIEGIEYLNTSGTSLMLYMFQELQKFEVFGSQFVRYIHTM